MAMSKDIPSARLAQQKLSPRSSLTASEIVGWLGAVQAQDYAGAKWALGLRMTGATDALIDAAFNTGAILRTHILRPTWHFVAPADIRWMLAFSAPRVKAAMASSNRRLELDASLLKRTNLVIGRALAGGKQLTRQELGTALARAGCAVSGLRLLYVIMWAELCALVCSGPRSGKQFTYALLEERVPAGGLFAREEALAELARRYITGHGPASARDFSWWAGLTLSEARAGLEMCAPRFDREIVDGQTFYFGVNDPQSVRPPAVLLLPQYDEFLIGFSGFDAARRGGRPAIVNGVYNPPIVLNGDVAGSWRRTFAKGRVLIEIHPFAAVSTSQRKAVGAAVQEFGRFLESPVEISEW